MKRTKKAAETSMDGWLVPSKSGFDYTSNEILIIGPPWNLDDASFSDLSERLVMGDHKSSLALMKTLTCTVVRNQDVWSRWSIVWTHCLFVKNSIDLILMTMLKCVHVAINYVFF